LAQVAVVGGGIGGMAAVGDCVTYTNPTMGQGTALALRTAQRIAGTADSSGDPAQFASAHHTWAVRNLKPWFDR
jgi:flavin-dependent dehydrogenase